MCAAISSIQTHAPRSLGNDLMNDPMKHAHIREIIKDINNETKNENLETKTYGNCTIDEAVGESNLFLDLSPTSLGGPMPKGALMEIRAADKHRVI